MSNSIKPFTVLLKTGDTESIEAISLVDAAAKAGSQFGDSAIQALIPAELSDRETPIAAFVEIGEYDEASGSHEFEGEFRIHDFDDWAFIDLQNSSIPEVASKED
jgi:hypothetical protein